MSHRYSFVTEPIFCDACFAIAKRTLARIDPDNYFFGAQVLDKPIIAGYMKCSFPGEGEIELRAIAEDVASSLCHDFTVFLIDHAGAAAIYFAPAAPAPTKLATD